ncbi:MAG: glycosyltransferase [Snowella sp.]|nr:glycosyltransferase [Snowella sp.]
MQEINISVAMATYNGEKYIAEQLESLSKQVLKPRELVICDDGSSDKTIKIIQEYASNSPFPVNLHQNSVNLGFADNFLQAASLCQFEWIAFCDQDDVWMSDKISTINRVILSSKRNDLLLITHSAELTDAKLNLLNTKQPEHRKNKYVLRGKNFGFWVVPGFTCVFSKSLIVDFDWKHRPPCYDLNYPVLPHDKWICLLANALGSTYYISRSLAFYRRHQSTVTGDYKNFTLQGLISLSRQTGHENYKYLCDIALEISNFLTNIPCQVDQKFLFNKNASYFYRLSNIYFLRSQMYSVNSRKKRLFYLFKLLFKKGYFGDAFLSLGLSSLFKDLFVCFFKINTFEKDEI